MIEVQTKYQKILVESSNEFETNETVYLDWTITSMHLMHQEKNQLEITSSGEMEYEKNKA